MAGKRRLHVLFWTDAAALVVLLALAGTGLVIEYALPPGTGGGWVERGGRGVGRGEVPEWFGLTRHEWGDVHYVLALSFLALMALHLALHAGWVRSYLRCIRRPRAAPPGEAPAPEECETKGPEEQEPPERE